MTDIDALTTEQLQKALRSALGWFDTIRSEARLYQHASLSDGPYADRSLALIYHMADTGSRAISTLLGEADFEDEMDEMVANSPEWDAAREALFGIRIEEAQS